MPSQLIQILIDCYFVAYEITVTTTDKKDAGMMHNGWVILEGDTRASKEFILENSAKNKVLRRLVY